MTIQTEYLVDRKGHKKSVVMSVGDYLKLMDYLEDLEDAVDLKKARQSVGKFTEFDSLRDKYKKQGRIK